MDAKVSKIRYLAQGVQGRDTFQEHLDNNSAFLSYLSPSTPQELLLTLV